MKITRKNNRLYFNRKDIAFGNLTIHNDTIKLELIKVLPEYRGHHLASRLLKEIIDYVKNHCEQTKIILSPLPIASSGMTDKHLTLQQLIDFYKRYDFKESNEKTKEEPYLMVRYL